MNNSHFSYKCIWQGSPGFILFRQIDSEIPNNSWVVSPRMPIKHLIQFRELWVSTGCTALSHVGRDSEQTFRDRKPLGFLKVSLNFGTQTLLQPQKLFCTRSKLSRNVFYCKWRHCKHLKSNDSFSAAVCEVQYPGLYFPLLWHL